MNPLWDPNLYARYADHRSRPFYELVSRVAAQEPALVVDLGCGNGPLTLALAERWPDARIVGVDASPEMLAAARELDTAGRVEWVEADLATWDVASLGAAPDVIVTNATLQWVAGHLPLIGQWVAAQPVGGWFAMQVPGNFNAPSHALMREVAETHSRAGELEAALKRGGSAEPATYLQILEAFTNDWSAAAGYEPGREQRERLLVGLVREELHPGPVPLDLVPALSPGLDHEGVETILVQAFYRRAGARRPAAVGAAS